MPPKPGFWYYDAQRAFGVYVLLVVFGLGVYLSKLDLPSTDELFELLTYYLVRGLGLIFLLILLIIGIALLFFLIKYLSRRRDGAKLCQLPNSEVISSEPPRIERLSEPTPSDFGTREEFVTALQTFGARKGYKPGWVYYRSEELWPER